MSLVNPLSRNVPQCALLFFTFLTPDTGAKLTPFNSGGGVSTRIALQKPIGFIYFWPLFLPKMLARGEEEVEKII
jgi:hypothetical protein